jgi:sugar O-acyltransferase (sialic acid O-acetyltransferase NeuD family)
VPRVVIIGAGAHAREVAEILRRQPVSNSAAEVLGYVDEYGPLHGQERDGLPVLGDWNWFADVDREEIRVICAVGQPDRCRELVARARSLGLEFCNAISPLAYVSPRSHLGVGVTLFPHVFVSTNARIDDHCVLNVATTVSHDSHLHAYSIVSPGVHIAGNVTLGEGCFIGIGASIIQQCSIGEATIIGAGATVVGDLEAHVTAVGVPARVIKRRV